MTIQQHIPCEASTFTLISCTRPAAASLVGKRNASVHRHVATYKPARCTVSARYLTSGYSDCDPATFALQIITHQIHILLDTLLNDQGSSNILCHQTSVLDKQYRTTTHAISSSATGYRSHTALFNMLNIWISSYHLFTRARGRRLRPHSRSSGFISI